MRSARPIVVGSKNFTESDLLGEIVAQQIERRTALPVERRFHLGGTFVCHQAITSGQIDLYVEYTGTAYTAVLKRAPVADRDSVYRRVARDYAQRFGSRGASRSASTTRSPLPCGGATRRATA